jgi:hypothetical protein
VVVDGERLFSFHANFSIAPYKFSILIILDSTTGQCHSRLTLSRIYCTKIIKISHSRHVKISFLSVSGLSS